MSTISLDLIPAFLAVAELGSFSAAADRLGVEKSSVSRAIGRLEHAVGDRLFLRTTRRVALTDAGQSVRDRLREPHANLEAALAGVMDAASSPRGQIVVTAPVDFGAAVLTEAIARFGRRYPHVEVDVRLSNQFLDLTTAGIDAAIRMAGKRLTDSSLKARHLGTARTGVFASPSYADARGLPRTPEEAKSHQWVVFRPLRNIRFDGPDGVTRFQQEGRVTCDDMAFAHHAVLHGCGLGVLPYFLVDQDIRQGRLIHVLQRWDVTGAELWFLSHARPRAAAQTVDKLRESVAEVLSAKSFSALR
ncbi:MAG TPA: LysR family transcriptional regulator [Vicinamibacterales bacterium]|nr:LysR family transcriptional regulator [Vicinamibacterales bacterium]